MERCCSPVPTCVCPAMRWPPLHTYVPCTRATGGRLGRDDPRAVLCRCCCAASDAHYPRRRRAVVAQLEKGEWKCVVPPSVAPPVQRHPSSGTPQFWVTPVQGHSGLGAPRFRDNPVVDAAGTRPHCHSQCSVPVRSCVRRVCIGTPCCFVALLFGRRPLHIIGCEDTTLRIMRLRLQKYSWLAGRCRLRQSAASGHDVSGWASTHAAVGGA